MAANWYSLLLFYQQADIAHSAKGYESEDENAGRKRQRAIDERPTSKTTMYSKQVNTYIYWDNKFEPMSRGKPQMTGLCAVISYLGYRYIIIYWTSIKSVSSETKPSKLQSN